MATSYYNRTIEPLPCMSFPFENTHGKSKRYLGNQALTGKVTATTTVICKDDDEMNDLHTFWRVDCNYGLEPFIFNAPLFGFSTATFDFLGEFLGDFKPTKAKNGIWTITLDINILAPIFLVRDDAGDPITDVHGEYIYSDASLHQSADNIISYITLNQIVI